MGGLSAHPLLPLPMGMESPAPCSGWRRRKAQQQPWKKRTGPLHSQECGLIVQGPGDTGEGGTSALDTVRAGLLNRLGDCLLTMGSEEQERFGWTGASWEGSPWSKAQAVSLWAENINC